jgi:hypothetical protein
MIQDLLQGLVIRILRSAAEILSQIHHQITKKHRTEKCKIYNYQKFNHLLLIF